MSTKTNFTKRDDPKGQSLVEFALSLTFMLILLAGAIDFGIGLFEYVAMRDAAQEGALYGSMNPGNTAGIRSRAANASGNGFILERYTSGELTITPSFSGAACEGNGITVTLRYDHPLSVPFIGAFIGAPTPPCSNGKPKCIRLTATVTDTILTPPCP